MKIQKIMSPTQLWASYDPYLESPEINIIKIETIGKCIIKHISFTSEIINSKKVRAYAKIYYTQNDQNKPGIIIADDIKQQTSDSSLMLLAEEGYIVAKFDYTGVVSDTSNNEEITIYPEELYYCNLMNASEYMKNATISSVKDLPLFHWSNIAFKITTVLKNDSLCSGNITIVGFLDGSDLLWPVAAYSKDVSAFISIFNAGWSDLSLIDYLDETSKETLTIGLAPESYAHLIKCPFLYISNANSAITEHESLNNIISRFPSETDVSLSISANNSGQIDISTLESMYKWIDSKATRKDSNRKTVQISSSIEEDNIHFKIQVNPVDNCEKVQLLLACAEKSTIPMYYWEKIDVTMNSEGFAEYIFDEYENGDSFFVYANATYNTGAVISSNLIIIKNLQSTAKHTKKSKIIYRTTMGEGSFFSPARDFFDKINKIKIIKGPDDIYALTSKSNIIESYNIGNRHMRGCGNYILQLNLFSTEKKDVILTLSCDIEGELKLFDYTCHLNNHISWSRFLLRKEDFIARDNSGSIEKWECVKSISFSNFTNVFLNNLMWI